MRKTCLEEIYQLAKKDDRVLFLGSDIGAGTLDNFKQEMPNRFFMEGVSEAHLIGMMSGLAMNGKIPYLNTIAVFLTRRCYEQILLDAAMHKLPIRLIGSGGGLVYASLGATHLAFDDFALMRVIPNMTIVAPCDAEEMKRLMPQTLDFPGPIYIRMGKGGDPIISSPDQPFEIGKAIALKTGQDVLLVSTGIATKLALDASATLEARGISTGVCHMHTVKPLDTATLLDLAARARVVLTVEEHSIIGGLGAAVAEAIAEANFCEPKKFLRIALPDRFPTEYGSQQSLMNLHGVSTERIIAEAFTLLNR